MDRESNINLIKIGAKESPDDFTPQVIANILEYNNSQLTQDDILLILDREVSNTFSTGTIESVLNLESALNFVNLFKNNSSSALTSSLVMSIVNLLLRDLATKGVHLQPLYATNVQGFLNDVQSELNKQMLLIEEPTEEAVRKVCNYLLNLFKTKKWFTASNETIAFILCYFLCVKYLDSVPMIEDISSEILF